MTISSLFWVPCGLILFLLVGRFGRDVGALKAEMKRGAEEMGG
jgi:hypothetical protein